MQVIVLYIAALYNNAAEFSGFPVTSEPVWLLGIKYDMNNGECGLSE